MVSNNYSASCTVSCMICERLEKCKLKDNILHKEIVFCDYAKEGCKLYKGEGVFRPAKQSSEDLDTRYDTWANSLHPSNPLPSEAIPFLVELLKEKYGENCLSVSKTFSSKEAKEIFCSLTRDWCADVSFIKKYFDRKETTLVTVARRKAFKEQKDYFKKIVEEKFKKQTN